jgi:PQQ-like domain
VALRIATMSFRRAVAGRHLAAGVGTLRSSPAIIGGVIYVGGNDGTLRAIGGSASRIQLLD